MVENLSQFIEKVNEFIEIMDLTNTTTTPWFRGQTSNSWKLIPNLYRYKNLDYYERDLNRDFKLLSKKLITKYQPISELEWLYLMQHYGLTTRLLDWSESSLVGLFFAVQNQSNTDNGRVWILSPRVYNALILHTINTVPTENSIFITDYLLKPDKGNRIHRKVKAELPLAIRPTKNSSRILAQRGVFTIHGNKSICINELLETIPLVNKNETLNYIDISGRHKSKILKELFQSGISHSVLFPELTGISQELLVRYTEFYQH